jgi:transposase-like protein
MAGLVMLKSPIPREKPAMTKTEAKPVAEIVNELFSKSPDGLRELVRAVMQEMLEAEMTDALGAEKGERSAARLGHRSGYCSRTLITRVGKLELRVPQDRDGRFSTELFERYQRSEQALVATLAEMYVQGVSTRKVKAITEELCGHSFSASAISAINKRLDESLEAFAGRPLEEPFPYLIGTSGLLHDVRANCHCRRGGPTERSGHRSRRHLSQRRRRWSACPALFTWNRTTEGPTSAFAS